MGLDPHYKVKLPNGRILGPLDLERIRALILKNHITGVEVAREHPEGEWRDINQFPPIAELLLKKASGQLKKEALAQLEAPLEPYRPILGPNARSVVDPTRISPPPVKQEAPPVEKVQPAPSSKGTASSVHSQKVTVAIAAVSEKKVPPQSNPAAQPVVEEEKTWVGELGSDGGDSSDDRTQVGELESSVAPIERIEISTFAREAPVPDILPSPSGFSSNEATRILTFEDRKKAVENVGGNPTLEAVAPGRRDPKRVLISLIAGIAVLAGAHEFLTEEMETKKPTPKVESFRPSLPEYSTFPKPDPARSKKEMDLGMRAYAQDTMQGYVRAARHLKTASAAQKDNWQAHAYLLSSYLHLTEASTKDDEYIKVILPLLERIQLNAKREPFAVQVQVEFYSVMNQGEAAAARLLGFLSSASPAAQAHPETLAAAALTALTKGDYREAAKYLNNIDFDQFKVARVLYLRGQTAEKLNDLDSAIRDYQAILKFQPEHAKSKLRLAWLAAKAGRTRDVVPMIDDLISKPGLLSPRDRAASYYLKGLSAQLIQDWPSAVAALTRAVALDPEQSDYLLEFYTARTRAGGHREDYKKDVTMFTHLASGQELVKAAQYHEALNEFLKAHRANLNSPLPLIRIGDMFLKTHDYINARMNYKLALDRAPRDPIVYTKYLSVLVQTYEFSEADKMINSAPQMGLALQRAAVERAKAERFEKQERHSEAQRHFRKAIELGYSDPALYNSYAKSLMTGKRPEDYKAASFYFAMALQLDPLNTDAAIGNAKCIAETEGIPVAIGILRDELVKRPLTQAELLTAIAELYLKKGEIQQAAGFVEQAKSANPKYGPAYYLEFKIWQTKLNTEKDAVAKGLQALETYTDLSPADPVGYIERFRQFMNKGDPEMAEAELIKIYARYPKFPNYHLYRGMSLNAQGKNDAAKEAFLKELENNAYNVDAYIYLGKTLLDQGKPGEALQPLNQALTISTEKPEAKRYAAIANLQLKNFQGASALLQSAIALDGGNPLNYRLLGNVYREMGDARNAAAAYRKYLELSPQAPDRNQVLPFIQ